MARERSLMGEVLHKIKNIIESENFPYSDARQEVSVGRGSADIVVYDKSDNPVLVFELKQPDGQPIHDPYHIDVVEQACGYATKLGVAYFVTTNLTHFVLWKTFQEGTPLLERRLLHYTATTPLDVTLRQILSDLIMVKEGKISFLNIDEKFILRLRTFHEVLWPCLIRSLDEKLKKNKGFHKDYIEWLYEQEASLNDETNKRIVKQYSHLLSNKIFFYKLLEGNFPKLPHLVQIDSSDEDKFKRILHSHFDKALEIDFEAVFSSTFFDTIPLNKEAMTLFNKFIHELEQYNLSEIEYDILGRVFESLIPPEERHYLGQYYTRADVVDIIEEFCIQSADDNIFDPACGSGTFLVRAYYHLKRLDKEKAHKQLLSQIYGTDINQFAAHLSVINLTIRDLSQLSNKVNVLVNDFFNLRPTHAVLLPFAGKDIRNRSQRISMPKFDAIVANPPYTRQEELGEYSEIYKQKLESALRDDWEGKYSIGKRAGIHAYFLLHAPKFLKPKGRLGFIVSNSWMETDYGKEIQRMLLENFRVTAIIESQAERWFEDAAVNTNIIIAQREDDLKKRDNNSVKFVLLKKRLDECDIKKLVKEINEVSDSCENEVFRIRVVNQHALFDEGIIHNEKNIAEWQGAKWGKYLRAPTAFFKLFEKTDKLVLLPEIANIKYGIKTGVTDYFVMERRRANKFGIEPQFLRAIVHSTKDLSKLILKAHDVPNVVFFTKLDKVGLRGTHALSYVKMGEEMEFSQRKSVTGRKHWWQIDPQEPPDIILTQFYNERHFAVYNKGRVFIENTFFGLIVKEDVSPVLLAAYLNSSLFALTKELYGRLNMGEGVLTIYGPDWKRMPVFDVRLLTKEQQQRAEKAFLRVARRVALPVSEELKAKDHQRLDDIFFDVLDISQKERKELCDALKELVNERVTKAQSVRKNGNDNGRKKKDKKDNSVNKKGTRNQQTLFEFIL